MPKKSYLNEVANRKNPKVLWSTIKKLNHQKNSVPNISPYIFNDHYCSTAKRLRNHKPLSSQEILKEIRSSETCDEFYFCSVSLSEIDYAIHNLKNNKIDYDGTVSYTHLTLPTIYSV